MTRSLPIAHPVARLTATWAGRASALALLAGLAACGPKPNEFAPACPVPGILADAADLTSYRNQNPDGRAQDITDMIVDGRIEGISGECKDGDTGTLDVAVKVTLTLTRGPAAGTDTVQVPYFVAVARGNDILDKRVLIAQASFPTNIDRITLTSDSIDLHLPVGGKVTGPAYTIWTGFQLNPAQLQLNRRRGKR